MEDETLPSAEEELEKIVKTLTALQNSRKMNNTFYTRIFSKQLIHSLKIQAIQLFKCRTDS